jgi:hypothetical protein
MRGTRIGTMSLSRASRRACLAGGLVLTLTAGGLAGVAILPASAAAASPIALDAPDNGNSPLVAYDPMSTTTYVAWSDPVNPGIDLCVLPASATGCEGGAPILLEDSKYEGYSALNHPGLGGLVILPNGDATVIGTPVSTGSVAWKSPGDGSAFLSGNHGLQNGGKFISPVSLFYTFGNAVALSNTDVGLLDDYGDYFSDSPFTAESPKIGAPTPNSNQTTPPGEFSRKSLEAGGPEVAAELAPPPAPTGTDIVVGVGDNFSGPSVALPGCLNSAGTGYGVSAGTVDGTSNAAGTLNAEGLPPYSVLACSALAPVLAQGGQDGIGVLEEEGSAISGEGSDWQMDYRPFIATATGGSFGSPVELADVTGEVLDGANSLDLAEDSGTGVYAMWTDEQGVVLDYSANGGANWEGPVVVPAPASGGQGNPLIAGVGGGTVLLAYESNPGTGNQVFLQALSYQALRAAAAGTGSSSASSSSSSSPAPTTLTTFQTAGTTTGASISVPAGTIGETDQATLSGTNAASATGTVSYGLYGTSSCTGAPLSSSTGTVIAGKVAASAPITSALAPGAYYWKVAYSGDALNDPSASTCGSEVLTVTPAATIEGTGESTSSTVTLTISCSSPCTVTVTITVPSSSGKASSARKSNKKHAGTTVTLGTGRLTLRTAGTKKLTVHLTRAGKRYLASHHGRVSARVLVSDETAGGTVLTTHTIKIVPAKHKHKK